MKSQAQIVENAENVSPDPRGRSLRETNGFRIFQTKGKFAGKVYAARLLPITSRQMDEKKPGHPAMPQAI